MSVLHKAESSLCFVKMAICLICMRAAYIMFSLSLTSAKNRISVGATGILESVLLPAFVSTNLILPSPSFMIKQRLC